MCVMCMNIMDDHKPSPDGYEYDWGAKGATMSEKSVAQQIREEAERAGRAIVKLKVQSPFTPDELGGIPIMSQQSTLAEIMHKLETIEHYIHEYGNTLQALQHEIATLKEMYERR